MATTVATLLFPLFLLLLIRYSHASSPDLHALRSFRSSLSSPSSALSSWSAADDPCSPPWLGVSCRRGKVTALVLEGLHLSGPIDALTLLPSLSLLSLKNNSFSSPLHRLSLSPWRPHLKLLFLSNNRFSGEFPRGLLLLRHLRRLDLAGNRFSGPIPEDIGNLLPKLLTLRLEGNRFSGQIPPSIGSIPSLSDLNLSNNLLTGEIPPSILKSFPPSAFSGNPTAEGRRKRKKRAVLILIPVAATVVVAAAFLILYSKRRGNRTAEIGGGKEDERLVFFEGCRGFAMEDLMRGSAEMLGRGSVGSTYRVVMGSDAGDGAGVVVKRVRRKSPAAAEERLLKEIGRCRHPNVVSLLAYYSDASELLLVSDYIPKGSLHGLLHGNRGPGRTPLDWTTRLKIALGAAKGLAFLHGNSKGGELCHQHLTSSNVLVDDDGNGLISDFALHQLLSPVGFEELKASQKCDVYSFGVVLLEMLTGRSEGDGEMDLAKWVQMVVREEWTSEVFDIEIVRGKEVEDEMVALLQVALLCLAADAKDRPRMSVVWRMIEDIQERGSRRGGRGSPSPSPSPSSLNDQSCQSSPGLSEDTATFTSS